MRERTNAIFVRDTERTLGLSYVGWENSILGLFGLGNREVKTSQVEIEAQRRFERPLKLSASPSLLGKVALITVLAGVAYGVHATGVTSQISSIDLSGVTALAKSIFGF